MRTQQLLVAGSFLLGCGRVADAMPDGTAPPEDTPPPADATTGDADADSGNPLLRPDGCPIVPFGSGCTAAASGKICSWREYECKTSGGYRLGECVYTAGHGWDWRPYGGPYFCDAGVDGSSD